jgi:cytochrome c
MKRMSNTLGPIFGVLGLCLMGAPASSATSLSVDSPEYKRGRLLYIQCRACHDLEAGGPRKVGPHLAGIVGRPSAAVSDFAYSGALESANLVWDAATLDRFLQRPSAVVPGNTMAFAGIANAADRAALITYLTVESTQSAETR